MTLFLPLILAAATATQPQPLEPADQLALRCSAAFAIVSAEQRGGAGTDWPPLGLRGREYFVQLGARLIDRYGYTRETLQQRIGGEVEALRTDRSALKASMPACLALLDAAQAPDLGRAK